MESVSPSISKHQEHCILRYQWEIGGGGQNEQALKCKRGKETVRQILKFYKGGWKAPHSLRLKDSAYKIPEKSHRENSKKKKKL